MIRQFLTTVLSLSAALLGFAPLGHAAPFLYVGDSSTAAVSVVDVASRLVTAVIPVGQGPSQIVVNPSGTRAYVSNRTDSTVSVIDTATNAEIDVDGDSGNGVTRVSVGNEPWPLAISNDGTRLYVASSNYGPVPSIVDTATNTVIPNPSTESGAFYYSSIAVMPDNSRVYLAAPQIPGEFFVFDTSTGIVTTIPALDGYFSAAAINPVGTALYLGGSYYALLSVINTATNSLITTIPGYSSVTRMLFNPSGSQLYVLDSIVGGSTLSLIDTATNTEIDVDGDSGNGVTRIALSDVVALDMAISPDGSAIYVIGSTMLEAVDTQTYVVTPLVAMTGNSIGFIPSGPPICGNGTLELGEDCDDNSTVDGDCCSSSCNLKTTGQCALAQCHEDLLQCEMELADVTRDTDNDGRPDLYDDCPGTLPAAAVDVGGCSVAQFCSRVDATTNVGKRACKKADWQNDEPLMRSRDRDCTLDRRLPGPLDDVCVPAP